MYCAISLSMEKKIEWSDFLYVDYLQFFESLGCKLIYLPNLSKNLESYFNQLPIKSIILSGGNDLSPEFTKQPAIDVRNSAPLRDAFEKKLLDLAVDRKIPVLGICRGMQFINSYFGGTMTQTINEDLHVKKTHSILFSNQNLIDLVGKKDMVVNSYHHQGIKEAQLSPKLKALALSSPDNLIEALYHPDFPIVGLQWHPERVGLKIDDNCKLTRAFIDGDNYWRKK